MLQHVVRSTRFLRVVSPLPPLMVGTFVVLCAAGSLVVALDADRTSDAMMPVLVLQLFAASSGFAGPARRGYYDILLTGGNQRAVVGLVHWGLSIGPGVAAWLWIALLEAVVRRGFPHEALAAGTVIAMLVVSCVAWACTVTLPRFSAAIGWLVLVVTITALWRVEIPLDGRGGLEPSGALAILVNPSLLVGRSLAAGDAFAVMPAVSLALGGVIMALWWIACTDFPLEASQ